MPAGHRTVVADAGEYARVKAKRLASGDQGLVHQLRRRSALQRELAELPDERVAALPLVEGRDHHVDAAREVDDLVAPRRLLSLGKADRGVATTDGLHGSLHAAGAPQDAQVQGGKDEDRVDHDRDRADDGDRPGDRLGRRSRGGLRARDVDGPKDGVAQYQGLDGDEIWALVLVRRRVTAPYRFQLRLVREAARPGLARIAAGDYRAGVVEIEDPDRNKVVARLDQARQVVVDLGHVVRVLREHCLDPKSSLLRLLVVSGVDLALDRVYDDGSQPADQNDRGQDHRT